MRGIVVRRDRGVSHGCLDPAAQRKRGDHADQRQRGPRQHQPDRVAKGGRLRRPLSHPHLIGAAPGWIGLVTHRDSSSLSPSRRGPPRTPLCRYGMTSTAASTLTVSCSLAAVVKPAFPLAATLLLASSTCCRTEPAHTV